MTTRTIIIGIVVIAIVALGAYFIFMNDSTPAGSQDQNATSTPRVEAQDITVGTGTEAGPGMFVSVLYVGRLADGTVFDSSEAHGNTPLRFQLGSTQGEIVPIPGFQIGINTMKVGGERRIAIPPTLGYGAQEIKDATGKVIIPADSTLIFDVKLVKVEPAPATTPTPAQ